VPFLVALMIICLVALAVVLAFALPHLRAGSRVLTPKGEQLVDRVSDPLRPVLEAVRTVAAAASRDAAPPREDAVPGNVPAAEAVPAEAVPAAETVPADAVPRARPAADLPVSSRSPRAAGRRGEPGPRSGRPAHSSDRSAARTASAAAENVRSRGAARDDDPEGAAEEQPDAVQPFRRRTGRPGGHGSPRRR
jgi:hypothetical protein